MVRAFSRARANTGNRMEPRIAIIEMTINNSINVNLFSRQPPPDGRLAVDKDEWIVSPAHGGVKGTATFFRPRGLWYYESQPGSRPRHTVYHGKQLAQPVGSQSKSFLQGASLMSISLRKQRWCSFFDGDPAVSAMVMVYVSEKDAPARPLPLPDNKQERIDWAWSQYEKQLERLEWLDDDTVPYLNPYTGTEIFAEAFGCQVHRPDNTNPFALPMIRDASEVASLRVPDIDTPCLSILFDITDELRRRGGPDAMVKLVDIQSPMDIAALIWEKTGFYSTLLDAPEAIMELAGKVRQLLTPFLDTWFSRYGKDFVAHYPDYYFPYGITLSEDEIGSVSTEVFEETFLPELVGLSNRYGAIGIHCCANATHQWEKLRTIPHLKLLNICQPVEVVKEAYSFFSPDIPQFHSWCGEGDHTTWRGQLPRNARAVLTATAEGREDALRILDALRSE